MGQVNAREAEAVSTAIATQSKPQAVPLSGVGATVLKVNIDGVVRTNEDLIRDTIKPVFKAGSFEDLLLMAHDARNGLKELGCFNDVGVHIDTCPGGGPSDYEVTFKVQEIKRVSGSINTMVGNQEGSIMTGVKLPNCFGRGERFQVDYSHGTKKTSAFNASYMRPVRGYGNKAVLTTSLYQQMGEFPPSGYKELNRGVLADLSFISAPIVSHNLQYDGAWRDLKTLGEGKSSAFSVREQCGHSLKSAIRHILTVDRRDDPVFPLEGTMFRLTQEYSGLGGDIGFFKNEAEIQTNFPLYFLMPFANKDDSSSKFCSGVSFQTTLNLGHLGRSQRDETKSITVADKFFLGGPMSVRGFEMRGAARQEENNAVGGTWTWSSGVHMFTPIPFTRRGGFADLFRTHVFATAGNLGEFEDLQANNSTTIVDRLTKDFRLSYGLGVAFALGGIARIELNYCIPAKSQRGDRISPGLQLGVGMNFL